VAPLIPNLLEKTSATNRATLSLGLASVAWGLWWLPVRWLAEKGLSGLWLSVVLYGCGAIALSPLLWQHWQKVRSAPYLWLISLCTGTGLILFNTALMTGEVLRVTLLFYLTPIWATLLAFVILKEPIRPIRLVSLAMGLLGAFVVLGGTGGIPLPRSLGEWLGLMAGVAVAAGSTFVRKAESTKGTASIGGLEQTCASFMVAGILGLMAALLLPATPLNAPPSMGMLWSLFPFAVGIALFWLLPQTVLYFWGAKQLDPGRVALLMLIEVPAAALSTALLLSDPLGWPEILGCSLVVLAGLAESLQQQT
jgi:drug/metabolite transporter (DMT)-like permease